MANNIKKFLDKGQSKPKEFVNNPKLLKALKTQKRNVNRNLSSNQYSAGPDTSTPGISEQNIREGMAGTNWGTF